MIKLVGWHNKLIFKKTRVIAIEIRTNICSFAIISNKEKEFYPFEKFENYWIRWVYSEVCQELFKHFARAYILILCRECQLYHAAVNNWLVKFSSISQEVRSLNELANKAKIFREVRTVAAPLMILFTKLALRSTY